MAGFDPSTEAKLNREHIEIAAAFRLRLVTAQRGR